MTGAEATTGAVTAATAEAGAGPSATSRRKIGSSATATARGATTIAGRSGFRPHEFARNRSGSSVSVQPGSGLRSRSYPALPVRTTRRRHQPDGLRETATRAAPAAMIEAAASSTGLFADSGRLGWLRPMARRGDTRQRRLGPLGWLRTVARIRPRPSADSATFSSSSDRGTLDGFRALQRRLAR